MKYKIKNRYTGEVQFVAEIDCDEDASVSVKIGLAVKWGIKTAANLVGANLAGSYLVDANLARANLANANLANANLAGANLVDADLINANLAGANLAGANLAVAHAALIDGGQRSDGYRFVGWIKDGVLQIRAGCRNLSISEARAHWLATRAGTPLGDETTAILDHIEAVARIRGLVKP